MCGITGIVYFDKNQSIDPSVLKRMTDTLYHRGPDDEGFYIYNNVGLGFRRLSIIDLSLGHQPLSDAGETIWIVFNGEIYNFRELRISLEKIGHIFRTNSDTETIIHLYMEYGEDCVKHLRGMFAFVIFDKEKNKIFCARDRFGIKPFFYYVDNEKFIFGSEIKSILKYPGLDRTISIAGLESYFTYGYITSDYSAFEHIKKLPPSYTIVCQPGDNRKISQVQYWKLNLVPDFSKTKDQWKEEILNCLEETIKLHLISDVPLGAFLSGGIDSSTVVALMSKAISSPVKTFSIGFKENDFDELDYAREIAEKYHTEHHEQIIVPESIDLLPLLVSVYDEPFADSSAIPTYYVSRFARKYVKVAISGDGGDELFAGYSSYLKMLKITAKNLLPDNLSNLLFGGVERIWPERWLGKGLLYYLAQKKETIGAYYCLWKQNERALLYRDSLKQQVKERGENLKIRMLEEFKAPDFITGLEYLDVRSYMVDDILTKVDRASMLNSLEVRVPLLDHVFAELAFSVPASLKIHNGDKKHILKYAASELLTTRVSGHAKQGFGFPLAHWFKDDLKTYMQDILFDVNQPMFSYLDPGYTRKVVDNHLKGQRDMSSKIWSLLFFNQWLKQNE